MARALRIVAPGLTYHVWSRGVGRMPIYRDDRDRTQFLELAGWIFETRRVDCHAYCLMTNHYHLVLTTNEANLSIAIQQVNSTYAQWWNRRHSRPGHVFQGRFGSQVVQDEGYLLTLSRYVVLNPVRGGLVASPEEWPWSSYRATAGLDAVPSILQPDTLWREFGCSKARDTWRRYRDFVAMGDAGPLPKDAVLGDEAFVERFREPRSRASSEVPERDRLTKPTLTSLFAAAFVADAREVAAAAAHAAGYSLKEIAFFLGVHYTTVSKMIARAAARRSVTQRTRNGVIA
jgi:putative transposase